MWTYMHETIHTIKTTTTSCTRETHDELLLLDEDELDEELDEEALLRQEKWAVTARVEFFLLKNVTGIFPGPWVMGM
jgi:hypothetical protein